MIPVSFAGYAACDTGIFFACVPGKACAIINYNLLFVIELAKIACRWKTMFEVVMLSPEEVIYQGKAESAVFPVPPFPLITVICFI